MYCHIGLVFLFIKYIKIIFLETQVDKSYASGDWWFVALSIYKKRKRKQRIPFWYSCHGGQVQFTSLPFLTGQLSWLWDEALHTYMYRYIHITTQHNMTDIGTEEFMMKWFSSTLRKNGFCRILFLTDCTAHFLLIIFSLDLKFMTILNNCLWKWDLSCWKSMVCSSHHLSPVFSFCLIN